MKHQNKVKIFRTSQVDLCKPNRALTVRQINERFVQGKPIPQAKQPIHEPKLESGINPMRVPYCDFTDVQQYNDYLAESLNKAESLYTEKRKQFDKEVASSQKAYEDSLLSRISKEKDKDPL